MGRLISSLLLKVCFFYYIMSVCDVGAAATLKIYADFLLGKDFDSETVYELPYNRDGDPNNKGYGLDFGQISAADAIMICTSAMEQYFSATVIDRNQPNLAYTMSGAEMIRPGASKCQSSDGLRLMFNTQLRGPIEIEPMHKTMTVICTNENSTVNGCGVFEFKPKIYELYMNYFTKVQCQVEVTVINFLTCLVAVKAKIASKQGCSGVMKLVKDPETKVCTQTSTKNNGALLLPDNWLMILILVIYAFWLE